MKHLKGGMNAYSFLTISVSIATIEPNVFFFGHRLEFFLMYMYMSLIMRAVISLTPNQFTFRLADTETYV